MSARKVTRKYTFLGVEVIATDAETFEWIMKKAGYVPDAPPEDREGDGWRVMACGDVFVVTETKEAATDVLNALRGAGMQGPSRIEPNI